MSVLNSNSDDSVCGPHDLSVTPIHLGESAGSAVPLFDFGFDGPSFQAYIEKYCVTDPGRLVMVETMASDWQHWE